jgi:hypothetical protein
MPAKDRPPGGGVQERYWLAFLLSQDEYEFIVETGVAATDRDVALFRKRITEGVLLLCRAGLRSFYEKPADLISLKPLFRKTADAGFTASIHGFGVIVERFLASVELHELERLADYMKSLLRPLSNEARFGFAIPEGETPALFALLKQVKKNHDPLKNARDITTSLLKLYELALSSFYFQPKKLLSIGTLKGKAADLGVRVVQRASTHAIEKLVRSLSREDIRTLAPYFESLLIPSGRHD